MSTDGGLRQLVRKNIPDLHWQSVETGGTGRGIPDDNFCGDSIEGWAEHKVTATMAVDLRPEQVGWIERRRRAGGRVFIFVRRTHAGGVRKGPPVDDLWLFPGDAARALLQRGLPHYPGLDDGDRPTLIWATNGPAAWPWAKIRNILLTFDFLSLRNGAIERNTVDPDGIKGDPK